MVRKEITAEVKRAWSEYLAAAARARLCRGQDSTAVQLRRIGQLRYDQGEINRLEFSMMNTLAAEQHAQWIEAEDALRLAARRLAWVCRSP